MTVFLIIIGIAILGIIIFIAGGKEIDKIVSAQGGFKTLYADVIRVLSSPSGSLVTEKTPSKIREFGIRNGIQTAVKKLNRHLEKVADSFGNLADI